MAANTKNSYNTIKKINGVTNRLSLLSSVWALFLNDFVNGLPTAFYTS